MVTCTRNEKGLWEVKRDGVLLCQPVKNEDSARMKAAVERNKDAGAQVAVASAHHQNESIGAVKFAKGTDINALLAGLTR